MIKKFTAALAAFALSVTALAPGVASAHDHGYRGGGYYNGGGYGGYNHGYYRHNDHGDAVAAGVVGLVLGLAVGAAASQPRGPRYSCSNGCYAPPPPPPPCGTCYNRGYYNQGYNQGYAPPPPPQYYQQGYNDDRGYDPRYDNSGLEGGYDGQRGGCTRSERQWDRYARQYVTVDVPC